MNAQDILGSAAKYLKGLCGHIFDLLTISKPIFPEAALNPTKVISKLSPLLGNLIEFNIAALLNGKKEFREFGEWERGDPALSMLTNLRLALLCSQ